jgi:hypothetical protein
MAQLGMNFDATQIEPSTGAGLPLVPPGKYLVHMVASEMRPTKDGTGNFLYVEFDILEGPYQGWKLVDRLNLINPNPQTVQIAQRTLSAICHAVGVMSVNDSNQLHARRMAVDVRVEEGKGQYRDSNRIVAYMKAGTITENAPVQQGTPMQQQPMQPQPVPAAQNNFGAVPAWRRSAQGTAA